MIQQSERSAKSLSAQVKRLRKRASSVTTRAFFEGASHLFRLHPMAKPSKHGVTVKKNLWYGTKNDAQRLDVYIPPGEPPYPVVMYVHGGGFRILSKETHWIMGLAFARKGYLVLNMEYRLAPKHRYPAALEDVIDAYHWVHAHAAEHGGDLDRLVVAGESAGANLSLALALATCHQAAFPENAAALFGQLPPPAALVLYSGILQVSDVERLWADKPMTTFLKDRLAAVSGGYLQGQEANIELADPLCVLESDVELTHALPPVFASVGTGDPLLTDTKRLEAVLERRGVAHDVRVYPKEIHAFQAFVMRQAARDSWRHAYDFLEDNLG